MYGRLTTVEGSLAGIESRFHRELQKREVQLKEEMRKELLRGLDLTAKELDVGHCPTAPPFVPVTRSKAGGAGLSCEAATSESMDAERGGATAAWTHAVMSTPGEATSVAAFGVSTCSQWPALF